jgi:hypothetical protein
MGRNYWGDIEGKFWFSIQPSDDASFFKEPSLINEDDDGDEVSLTYSFDESDIELLEDVLEEINNELGPWKEKIDNFCNLNESFSEDILCKETGIFAKDSESILALYARMKLGNQILDCIKENGECVFECEL